MFPRSRNGRAVVDAEDFADAAVDQEAAVEDGDADFAEREFGAVPVWRESGSCITDVWW